MTPAVRGGIRPPASLTAFVRTSFFLTTFFSAMWLVGCSPPANSWAPFSDEGGLLPRYGHLAVWTGSEVLVWGGLCSSSEILDGATHDLGRSGWTPVDPGGPPYHPYDLHMWTGEELLIWFGGGYGGARYDPAADTWCSMSQVDAPPSVGGMAGAWTGTELIVWGGSAGELLSSGGRYDPSTDSWRPTSEVGAPSPRADAVAVWTGTHLFIWGGVWDDVRPDAAALYDPVTDTWTPTAVGGPEPWGDHDGIWTGEEVLIWGGGSGMGWRYSPTDDTWTTTAPIVGYPLNRYWHSLVWTGTEMIIWGGMGPEGFGLPEVLYDDGWAYDPAADTWRPLPVEGAPSPRRLHAAVWTGEEMIVWGGSGLYDEDECFGDGARYRP